jgi:anti-anti-sigma factor
LLAIAGVAARGPSVSAAAAQPEMPVRPSAVVVVDGDLELSTAGQLRDRLHQAADGRARLVVDLRAVSFVDVDGGQALAGACVELRSRQVDTAVVPCSALERLVARLAEHGRTLELPAGPTVIDADADVVALTLTPTLPGLRPVEARVLRLLDAGLSATEVAFRFQRSVRWVEQVAAVARRRAQRSQPADDLNS